MNESRRNNGTKKRGTDSESQRWEGVKEMRNAHFNWKQWIVMMFAVWWRWCARPHQWFFIRNFNFNIYETRFVFQIEIVAIIIGSHFTKETSHIHQRKREKVSERKSECKFIWMTNHNHLYTESSVAIVDLTSCISIARARSPNKINGKKMLIKHNCARSWAQAQAHTNAHESL